MTSANEQIKEYIRQIIKEELANTHPIRPTNATTFVSSVPNSASTFGTSSPIITDSLTATSSNGQPDLLEWLYKTLAGRTICGMLVVIIALVGYIYFGERDGIKETIKDISKKVDVIDKKIDSVNKDLSDRMYELNGRVTDSQKPSKP